MRILVTGGAGFIGSHVVKAFVEAGHEVVVIDNLSTGRREHIPEGAQFVPLDLSDGNAGEIIAQIRPDVVDHHAALADVRQSADDPILDARVNLLGTIAVIQAAVQAGTRKVIFASSGGAIYGDPTVLPCGEDYPAQPLSPYAASKRAGEIYLETRLHEPDYTILRYANVYGPRQHPYTEEGQVVAIFSRQMLAGQQPTIFGDGQQGRDFVYVDDIVEANLRALDRGSGRILNLGTGHFLTVNDLYGQLQKLTGYGGPPRYAAPRAGEVFRIALEASRARKELGWEPRTSLEDGLRATVEWMRQEMARGSAEC